MGWQRIESSISRVRKLSIGQSRVWVTASHVKDLGVNNAEGPAHVYSRMTNHGHSAISYMWIDCGLFTSIW